MLKPHPPPHAVEHGAPGQPPPPHVRAVRHDALLPDGDASVLARLGLGAAVAFDAAAVDGAPDGRRARLLALNRLGVAFAVDHRAAPSPSELMHALHAAGALRLPFHEIAWQAPGRWLLITRPAPVS